MQEIDPFVVADLRNFLFAQHGEGGMDLIAINLQRGRDHGLPSLNQAREALGLVPHKGFASITSNHAIVSALEAAYGEVDLIDLWIGAMAEDHVEGASVGETLATALAMQFSHLRDGDRFFFLVDEALSEEEKEMIRRTTLADVIRRNTQMQNIQDSVFMAPARSAWMDSDHDGVADIREVIAGTDPLSAASGLRSAVPVLGPGQQSLTLEWTSVPEKRYLIERAGSLHGSWEPLEFVNGGAGLTTSLEIEREGGASQAFFRVVISE